MFSKVASISMLGIFIWEFLIYKGNQPATKVLGMNIVEKFWGISYKNKITHCSIYLHILLFILYFVAYTHFLRDCMVLKIE